MSCSNHARRHRGTRRQMPPFVLCAPPPKKKLPCPKLWPATCALAILTCIDMRCYVRWETFREEFAEPRETTVPVSRAEYVEVLKTERMRLPTSGAPQRMTLKLSSMTSTLVAVRRHLHSQNADAYCKEKRGPHVLDDLNDLLFSLQLAYTK